MTNLIREVIYKRWRSTPKTRFDRLLDAFADFERHEGPIPLPYLKRRLRGLTLRRDDVAEHIAFRDSFYQRNRLYDGDGFQALILCWRSGQRSPIHNHAGSNCLVKVIEGTATEIQFAYSDCGLLLPRHARRLRPGDVGACQDRAMHQMGNFEPAGRDLITLHVYSPPLRRMELFSLTDSVFANYDNLLTCSRQ